MCGTELIDCDLSLIRPEFFSPEQNFVLFIYVSCIKSLASKSMNEYHILNYEYAVSLAHNLAKLLRNHRPLHLTNHEVIPTSITRPVVSI